MKGWKGAKDKMEKEIIPCRISLGFLHPQAYIKFKLLCFCFLTRTYNRKHKDIMKCIVHSFQYGRWKRCVSTAAELFDAIRILIPNNFSINYVSI
jgi:hypothetical protein